MNECAWQWELPFFFSSSDILQFMGIGEKSQRNPKYGFRQWSSAKVVYRDGPLCSRKKACESIVCWLVRGSYEAFILILLLFSTYERTFSFFELKPGLGCPYLLWSSQLLWSEKGKSLAQLSCQERWVILWLPSNPTNYKILRKKVLKELATPFHWRDAKISALQNASHVPMHAYSLTIWACKFKIWVAGRELGETRPRQNAFHREAFASFRNEAT